MDAAESGQLSRSPSQESIESIAPLMGSEEDAHGKHKSRVAFRSFRGRQRLVVAVSIMALVFLIGEYMYANVCSSCVFGGERAW